MIIILVMQFSLSANNLLREVVDPPVLDTF